jgi:putative MATE family efflux protein
MISLIYAVAFGLAMAATATVARRIGEKNRDGAAVAAVQTIALGLLVALPLGVIGAFAARPLLAAMGAAPETVEGCGGYTVVMFGGNATILLLFLINAVFRGAGDASVAMRTLWLANGLNIVLDPCFIYGWGPFPELGITGAAVATNVGRGIGVLYLLRQLARGSAHLSVRREHVRLVPETMLSILRLSGTAMFQMLISTTSWIGLVRVISRFGDQALAGYAIGIRVVIFGLLPSWGMSNAAATMVGQSLGARDPARAERSVWLACFYNLIFLGAVGLVFVLGAPLIVGCFGGDAVVSAHAVDCLRIVSSGFLFYAFGMVLVQAFNGAGDPWTPTWINFGCFWLFEVPLAFLLAHSLGLGPRGVFIAIAAAFSTYAVVAAWLFRRGRWKTRKV